MPKFAHQIGTALGRGMRYTTWARALYATAAIPGGVFPVLLWINPGCNLLNALALSHNQPPLP